MAAAVWLTLDSTSAETGTMSVLPGFHRRGALRTAAAPFLGFTQQVDPAELPEPAELEAALLQLQQRTRHLLQSWLRRHPRLHHQPTLHHRWTT